MMRAMVLEKPGTELRLIETPKPVPKNHQVLIKVPRPQHLAESDLYPVHLARRHHCLYPHVLCVLAFRRLQSLGARHHHYPRKDDGTTCQRVERLDGTRLVALGRGHLWMGRRSRADLGECSFA